MKRLKTLLLIIISLFLASCTITGGVDPHEHTPKEEYKYDDVYHFQAALWTNIIARMILQFCQVHLRVAWQHFPFQSRC